MDTSETPSEPYKDIQGIISDEPIEIVLGNSIGENGTISFWFQTDKAYRIGNLNEVIKLPLVELQNIGTVYFERNDEFIRFVFEWAKGIKPKSRDMEILLPEFPHDGWHHFAVHWDSEAGIVNAFLDGTPFHWTDQAVTPWSVDRTSDTITVFANTFALANIQVTDEALTREAIQKQVGEDYLGKLDALMGSNQLPRFSVEDKKGRVLYSSTLTSEASVEGWTLEGPGALSFSGQGMVMESTLPDGPNGHSVFWCPARFPDSFIAEWNFTPLNRDGLCIVFFAASGSDGIDIFDPSLAKRDGVFKQYIKGDFNNYHISYYANTPEEPRRTAHLRKNSGFYLVSNGPVGIRPGSLTEHHVILFKEGPHIRISVDGNTIIDFVDEDSGTGEPLKEGRIGLRQMQWTKGLYSDFEVYEVEGSKP